jgi:quinone-modifying oxidoreductase subunit QmoB
MGEGDKYRVLAICSGCGIGESVDTAKLEHAAREAQEGLCCMQHPALCSAAGLEALKAVADGKEAVSYVIAACSPRSMSGQFGQVNGYVERVNLREQMAWVMEAGGEDTQMYAEDQVRMALARVASIGDNHPYMPEQVSREVMVLGGGIAGLHAALAGARAGYRIHLVEKEERLGGFAGRIYKMLPAPGDETGLREPDVAGLADRVLADGRIRVHLESMVASIGGEPGNFRVRLKNREKEAMTVGSVVLSNGWKPYDAGKLKHLGHGISPAVKTLEEFEAHVAEAPVPDRVLFILCAGSRDPSHLPYCSAYCCSAALKQALYVREKNPDSRVYLVYRDIRTEGFREAFYRQVQADDAIFMTRGSVSSVNTENGILRTLVRDSLLDGEVVIESDMVVLATGMVPNSTEDLHLEYRLGEGLPGLEYDFSDSHFICFPYETRRTGIYAAGAVRAPMDMDSAAEDGEGAMMKAIQCIESVSRGTAVHPRAGDQSYPELYMERCTDCKRCTEECPFGSYDETEKGTPLPNPARCRRCGICVGSCPERVIGFPDFSINSVSAMIKAVHVPDEFEEKPRILVFLCENDAYPALDAAGVHHLPFSSFVRIIPVRCLGSVNKVWISDALSHGYDGILQIGCKPGDDYQCHFIHGSELTEQRGENLQETLETMMLEPERIRTRFVEITDHHAIVGLINEYVEELEEIGPNPYK